MSHQSPAQGQLSRTLVLTHRDGSLLYPIAITNRKTGRVAWNVAKSGGGNNVRSAAIEIEDEELLIKRVLHSRWSVRCQAEDGSHPGLFNPDGREIIRAERA